MSDRFGIAGKLYRRRRRYGGCRIASSSQAITAAAGIPNVSPGASLPIGMPPAVVFDLVGQSAAAATAALRALLAPFNWPLLRMPTPISGGIPFGDTVGEPFSDRYRLSIGIGEGLDDGLRAGEG